MITPLLKGAKSLGRKLLTAGAHVARDVLAVESIGSSIQNRAKEAKMEMLDGIAAPRAIERKRKPNKIKLKKRRRDIYG